ncbi:hypothetical protein CN327_29820 [Bacillus cereus]|nr:hypothetical protein CON53_27885 [Bacillus cereus]PES82467.1 hypothetical protein CN509_06370 [Bacillus cereus]PET08548.1 hypothetical protein CN505_04880 [Bacillus cereus]PFF27121.1 hypothetical protein CN327_29820 [Bacillus cereus]PFH93596.1 hypothetical protein COI81_01910 [Bacillus cereus]
MPLIKSLVKIYNFLNKKESLFSQFLHYIGFWCKNKTKENKAHIFLTESYLILQVQTIDG